MKIAYIGIDLFMPALRALVESKCDIMEIFTCETDNVTEFNTEIIAFAENNHIPYTLNRITVHDFLRLYANGCEAVICAGYYYKIPVFDNIPTVNIHPTLLPYGRGSWPMPYDILHRRKSGGVTIHKISENFDEGDILLQRSFDISENENHCTLMDKVYGVLPEMIDVLVSDFINLFTMAQRQGEGVYLPLPDRSMYTINATTPVECADRVLRAFYGYECYYNDGKNDILLIKAKAVKGKCRYEDKDKIRYSVSGGYVVI